MVPVIEINQNGNINTLWSDELDLYELGIVHDVRRASNVVFDHERQEWKIILPNGKIIGRDKNRSKAIEQEIRLLSPGGLHHENTSST
jgi:hypothetical protein